MINTDPTMLVGIAVIAILSIIMIRYGLICLLHPTRHIRHVLSAQAQMGFMNAWGMGTNLQHLEWAESNPTQYAQDFPRHILGARLTGSVYLLVGVVMMGSLLFMAVIALDRWL